MRHDVQFLPLAALRGAAALMVVLIVVGCSRSGDVVVVLDSSTGAEPLEVVAVPTDPRHTVSVGPNPAARGGDSVITLRALDDTAAAFDTRFRALRDSLNTAVQALDTADRRTRSYATRYAAIRQRTLAAEALRGDRDSVRARADRLRTRLGPRADSGHASATAGVADRRAEARRALQDSTLTLSLEPGQWWIGLARAGAMPRSYDTVTVERGAVDTIRLRPPARP